MTFLYTLILTNTHECGYYTSQFLASFQAYIIFINALRNGIDKVHRSYPLWL